MLSSYTYKIQESILSIICVSSVSLCTCYSILQCLYRHCFFYIALDHIILLLPICDALSHLSHLSQPCPNLSRVISISLRELHPLCESLHGCPIVPWDNSKLYRIKNMSMHKAYAIHIYRDCGSVPWDNGTTNQEHREGPRVSSDRGK